MDMPDCLRHMTRSLERVSGGFCGGGVGDARVMAGHGGWIVSGRLLVFSRDALQAGAWSWRVVG